MKTKDGSSEVDQQNLHLWLAIRRERKRCRYEPLNSNEPKPIEWLTQPQKIDGNLDSI